jgi:hypothetical protein
MNKMTDDRANFDSMWEELNRFCLPRKDDVYWQSLTKGEKKGRHLFDGTGWVAVEELATALHSSLTNSVEQWFKLSTGDPKLDQVDAVRLWLQDTEEKMRRAINDSNFTTAIHECYLDLCSMGTSVLFMARDDKRVIKFASYPIFKGYITENAAQEVDTFYRMYRFTAKQLVQEFGEEHLPDDVLEAFGKNDPREFDVINAVEPRLSFFSAERAEGLNPWVNYHVLKDTNWLINDITSGYERFPYAISRFSKLSDEAYGRGPAEKALSDIRMMQSMKKVTIQSSQISLAPPLQIQDSSLIGPMRYKPWSLNFVRPGSDDIKPITTGTRMDIGLEIMRDIKDAIRQAFFLDKLTVPSSDRMTATEISARKDENMRTLSAVLGRLNQELTGPIINNTFKIMSDQNAFLEIPKELEGLKKIDIKYISLMARSQSMIQAEAFQRAIGLLTPLVEANPAVMDNIDSDQALKIIFDIFGIDQRIVKKKSDVDAVRKQRAEQQKQQQQLAMQQMQLEMAEKAGNIQQGNQGQ